MIEISMEKYQDIKDEVKSLTQDHFVEAGMYPDKISLGINEAVVSSDFYYLFVARDDGELVGYIGYFVQPAQHYDNVLMAIHDVIYVDEAHRSMEIASSLIDFAEEIFSEIDVKIMTITLKRQSSLARNNGYDLDSYLYTKFIGKENG